MPVKYNPSVKAEIVEVRDDATIVRALVTPFGSPSKKDLHGEFFHDGTYFGDDVVTTKFGLYEHLMNSQSNPFMSDKVEKHILGKATLAKTDEWGRWFDFEIKRSLEYHDFLVALVSKGLMGASTQCFPNGKRVDAKIKGKIDVWLENEASLTPTPAAPDTIGAETETSEKTVQLEIYELAKAYGLPIQMVKNGEIVDFTEELDNIEENVDVVSTTEPVDTEDNFDADVYAQQVAAALEGKEVVETATGDDAAEKESDDQKALYDLVYALTKEVAHMKASMFAYFEIWGNDMTDAKEAVNQLLGNSSTSAKAVDTLTRINRKVDGLTKAQLSFATYMKAFKDGEAGRRWERMSSMERTLLDNIEQEEEHPKMHSLAENLFSGVIPEGAPGN